MDDYISALPRPEQVIVRRLREIVLNADPRMREQFSYGVPCFFRKRRICFIWPQSAPYGPKDALASFGFCYGNMLSNEQGILKAEGRTQVYIVKYSALAEIDEGVLNEILQEAILVDELPFGKTKIKK